MTRREALLLRASAAWTLFIWAVLVKNIVGGDRPFGFKAVHLALAVVSVSFALATWRIVSTARTRTRA
jgi:hypothetical protein